MEAAFAADPVDARILLEIDHLRKRLNIPIWHRLLYVEEQEPLVLKRDDLYREYVTLLNLHTASDEALPLLSDRNFNPCEGGEGKLPPVRI